MFLPVSGGAGRGVGVGAAREVSGPPPGSSSKALQEEVGSRSSMPLCYPSAAPSTHLYSSHLPSYEDENKISLYLHNVLSSPNTRSLIV